MSILSVEFPTDNRPVVKFTAKDNARNTIPLQELTDTRFILAYLETPAAGSTARYLSYTTNIEDPDRTPNSGDEATQAAYDSARLGGVTQAADGVYSYRFARTIPAAIDRAATHQVGGQFRRQNVVDGVNYPTNAVLAFRPDGGKALASREIVDTETCNECHTRLNLHGIRRDIQLCILCHNTQSADANSGNTVDFPAMVHKIHMGENLPSVEAGQPYQIVGFGNTVHDYSDVVFPQDIRNCTVCHTSAPQADVHLTKPTLAGCVSCHDRTWFGNQDQMPAGYTPHVGGIHTNDLLCALCHTPTAPGSAPIAEAHVLPTESSVAPGLAFDITAVNTVAGDTSTSVQITFTAVNGAGNPITDLNTTNAAGATIAWPAPEYQTYVRETVRGSARLVNNGGGSYTYTFQRTFTSNSTDTYAVALDGRQRFTFRGQDVNQGTSTNALTYFTLNGSTPIARRTVVEEEQCNKCHDEIRFHGTSRVGVDYCVMCHNPNTTDIARRPVDQLPPETVNFKDMIHKIHSGEHLEGGYTAYGFGNVAHDYSDVRFPGDRRQCTMCHVSGTEGVPLPVETLSTRITQDSGATLISDKLPTRAACASCHDGVAADVHALLNTETSRRVETCVVCHGAAAAFPVKGVHVDSIGP